MFETEEKKSANFSPLGLTYNIFTRLPIGDKGKKSGILMLIILLEKRISHFIIKKKILLFTNFKQ